MRSLLLLLLLLVVAALLATASGACLHEETLPLNLDTNAYLGFAGELTLHGDYLASFGEWRDDVFFTLQQESATRFYVAAHQVDIDLWLTNMTTVPPSPVAHSSLYVGTEEVIEAVLPPGSYRLRFVYYGSSAEECDTMTVAMRIIPTARLAQQAAAVQCPADEAVPIIDWQLQAGGPDWTVHYDSESMPHLLSTLNLQSQANLVNSRAVRWVHGYNFTVPQAGGTMWSLNALLGFDLITGGSMGLMLERQEAQHQPSLSCGINACQLAVITRHNEAQLQALLAPGPYTLWLYDAVGEKTPGLIACTEFSFKLDIKPLTQPENFLTCTARSAPSLLTLPGLMDQDGRVNFQENVLLDITHAPHTISFTLSKPSIFRVMVGAHRVDIDLMLKVASTGQVIARSNRFSGDEFIVSSLEVDSYELVISFFGEYAMAFCETYLLDLGIKPVEDIESWNPCSGLADASPDLSDLQTQLDGPEHTFHYVSHASAPLVFQRSEHAPGSEVVSTIINTNELSQMGRVLVKARVGANFLLGDMQSSLVAVDPETNQPLPGAPVHRGVHHAGGFVELVQDLEPGWYKLAFAVGEVQNAAPQPDFSSFPSCVQWSLDLYVGPPPADPACQQAFALPPTLNGPEYLATTRYVRVSGDFLAPPGRIVTQDITIDPEVDSYLRVYTDPHTVDIDFHLLEGGKEVASAIEFNREETISYRMVSKEQYILRVKFYRWGGGGADHCDTWHLELSVAPVDSERLPTDCPNPALPGPDTIKASSYWPQSLARVYEHQQVADTPMDLRLPFTVSPDDEMAAVRAKAEFDFVWGPVSLYIMQGNQILYTGAQGPNANDLGTLSLPPGDYELRLLEGPPSDPGLVGCAMFRLELALDFAANVILDPTKALGCQQGPLPPSWNSIRALSTVSGSMMHFERPVLANVKDRTDNVLFQLDEPALVRMYIADHQVLDIDYFLRQGNSIVSSGTGFGAEGFYHQLLANTVYTLQLRYYARPGKAMPLPSSCTSFDLEFAVETMGFLAASVPGLSQACPATSLPDTLVPNQRTQGTYSRDLQAEPNPAGFQHSWQFSVGSDGGLLDFQVYYSFVTGGLELTLAPASGQSAAAVEPAHIGINHAWIVQPLSPGDWTLTLRNRQAPSTAILAQGGVARCARLSIDYMLNVTGGDPDHCGGIVTQLPPDLALAEGTQGIGGPQNAVGEVQIYGRFQVPETRTHNYILFDVPTEPCMVRFFVQSLGASDVLDVDFFLFNSTEGGTANLVNMWIGTDDIESGITTLPPLAGGARYMLDVYVFRSAPADPECPSMHFELAIKTQQHSVDDMRCPVPRPAPELPPAAWNFYPGQDVDYQGDLFVVTKSAVEEQVPQGQRGHWSTTLTLATHGATAVTDLSVTLGFNFVENDFRLELWDANGQQRLASGKPTGAPDRSNFINFYNTLLFSLQPDTQYQLQITMLVEAEPPADLRDYCHRFAFYLAAAVAGQPGDDPVVSMVMPPGGSDLSPDQDLSLTVHLSEAAVAPAPEQLEAALAGNLYLRPTEDDSLPHVEPGSLAYTDGQLGVHAVFPAASLLQDTSYTLWLQPNVLTNAAGKHFVLPAGPPHQYNFTGCDCSGHGHCSPQGVCQCDLYYTGDRCQYCADGSHGVGTQCVVDVPCESDSCSGHGRCDDSQGYPVCQCDTGFASGGQATPCGQCAQGFEDFPSCQPIPEPEDRPTSCKASLLPPSLDTPGGLGWNGQVHLRDAFFLDLDHRTHHMEFSLQQDSVIRVYVEPHMVDIDIWLWSLKPDGSWDHSIAAGLSVGREESIFVQLAGRPDAPKRYALRLRYYLWGVTPEKCPTANMEIAISPVEEVQHEAAAWASVCGNSAAKPLDGMADGFSLPISLNEDPWVYEPTTVFSVTPSSTKQGRHRHTPLTAQETHRLLADKMLNARETQAVLELPGVRQQQQQARRTGGGQSEQQARAAKGHVFWEKPFVVPDAGPMWVAEVHAELGYRFLPGDMTLVLLVGEGDSSTCAGQAKAQCMYGDNRHNRNVLHTHLPPGRYTLFAYEPLAQDLGLAACSVYQFTMEAEYVRALDSVFSCPQAAEPPTTFAQPGFLDASTGYMHVHDTWLVSEVRPIDLIVDRPSLFRLSAQSQLTSFAALVNTTGAASSDDWTLIGLDLSFKNKVTMWAELTAGTYKVAFYSWALTSDSVDSCAVADVEVAVSPAGPVAPDYQPRCPNTGADVLPNLPNPVRPGFATGIPQQDAPFQFTWSTFQSGRGMVADWPLVVDEPCRLWAAVDADFLRADLTLSLMGNDSVTTLLQGSPVYNRNLLQTHLDPGTYSVRLSLPMDRSFAGASDCVPFHLGLRVDTMASLTAGSAASNPLFCQGANPDSEDMLHAFDVHRLLLVDGRMNFLSKAVRMPWPIVDSKVWRDVNFTVAEPSMLRVYVEPHQAVDIDIALYSVVPTTGVQSLVAAGSDSFNGEESLVASIATTFSYRLVLTFWRPIDPIDPCPTFNFEVALEPTQPVLPAVCPHGGARWAPAPPATGMPATPYVYDSAGAGDSLYFQQSVQGPASHTYTWTWGAQGNLHVEVSYAFAQADLVLKLVRTDGATQPNGDPAEVWWGVNHVGRQVLNAKALAAGQYSLTVYEPIISLPSTMGCAPFTWTIVAATDSNLGGFSDQSLPDSLNGLAFLGYSHEAHIRDLYRIQTPDNDATISAATSSFTLQAASMVRVHADLPAGLNPGLDRAVNIVLRPSGGDSGLLTADNDLVGLLPAGDYELKLTVITGFIINNNKHTAEAQRLLQLPAAAAATTTTTTTTSSSSSISSSSSSSIRISKAIDALRDHGEDEGVFVNVEFQSHQQAELSTEIVSFGHGGAGCTPSDTPTLLVSPRGYASFASDTLTYPSNQLTQAGKVLHDIAFTVKEDSVVWANVGTAFVLNHLAINLTSLDGSVTHRGFAHLNSQEVYELVPAGSYRLIVWSPTAAPNLQGISWCNQFSLHILVSTAAASGHYGDCSQFDAAVPWDLNDPEGGSAHFGGPLRAGPDGLQRLSMHGDRFLFPEAAADGGEDAGSAADSVQFALDHASVVTVFTGSRSQLQVEYTMYKLTGSGPVPVRQVSPMSTTVTRQAHVETWSLSPGSYVLSVQYLRYWTLGTNCPYFSLHIDIGPTSDAASRSLCPEQETMQLPATELSLDAGGFARDRVYGYWPALLLPASGNYSIMANVTQSSFLSAFVGFSSSVSQWNLVVERMRPDGTSINYSGLRVLHEADEHALINTGLGFNRGISPGLYKVTLQHVPWSTIQSSLGLDTNYLYCTPFSWNLLLTPRRQSASSQPFVAGVEPPGQPDMAPGEDLEVTVHFSTSVYDSDQTLVSEDNVATLRDALYLRVMPARRHHRISSSTASSSSSGRQAGDVMASTIVGSASSAEWTFTFSHVNMQVGTTYQLSLRPGRLYDLAHQEVMMPPGFEFDFSSMASCPHGNFDSHYHCICDTGYAGVLPCQSCDVGYLNVADAGEDANCVAMSTLTCSTPNVCGCLGASEACQPLGQCSSAGSDGGVTCACDDLHTGPFCRQCKDPSRQLTWPTCEPPKPCEPACQHGSCDPRTGTCKCTGNWDGPQCSTCKAGYSGPQCADAVCSPACQHGQCVGGACLCSGNWDGPDCSACKEGFEGDDCAQPVTPVKTGSLDWKVIIFGALVAVLALAVVVGILIYWRRKKGLGARTAGPIRLSDLDDAFDDEAFELEPTGLGRGEFSLNLDPDVEGEGEDDGF